MTSPRVLFLMPDWPEHGEHSGYGLLARYVQRSRRLDPRACLPDNAPTCRRCDRPWYSESAKHAEQAVTELCRRGGFDAVHVLDAEANLDLLVDCQRRHGVPLVASFHQTGERLRYCGGAELVGRISDGLVLALCDNQAIELARLRPGRLARLRHGVDTHWFRPALRYEEMRCHARRTRVLFIDGWGRDHAVLHDVVNRTLAASTDIEWTILSSDGAALLPSARERVRRLNRQPDSAYRALLWETDVLCLPLVHATANNALLEAMACGVAIVVTHVGGVRETIDRWSAVTVPPGDARAMTTAILTCAQDTGLRHQLGSAARRQALSHSWPRVAADYQELVKSYVQDQSAYHCR
ncbi:MAG: glycosyltransferase family 4 protein [Phycisphaerales bacterium]|nr:glycosyltransferase family 4 protein [Phycisphaerales bacterium]